MKCALRGDGFICGDARLHFSLLRTRGRPARLASMIDTIELKAGIVSPRALIQLDDAFSGDLNED